MPETLQSKTPPEGNSLPWASTSAVELLETGAEPSAAPDFITGSAIADDDPDVAWPRRSRSALWAWLACLCMVGAGAWFGIEVYQPMRAEVSAMTDRLVAAEIELGSERARAGGLAKQVEVGAVERKALGAENAKLGAAAAAREKRIEVLAAAKKVLAERLADRVKARDLALALRGDKLVVTLADSALFSDTLVLSEPGKGLLGEVGGAVRPLGSVAVAAYYDYVPSTVKTQNPTVWHLTAARASAVAWFLESGAKIPARRLSPVGYGSSRTSARQSRSTKRRIELEIGAPGLE